MVQSSWIKAKLWVGEEVEGGEKELRLFVDGASYEEIERALKKYPKVKAVYFGHRKDWNAVRKLINKVKVVIEVGIKELEEVPLDILGEVEVVLRIPKFVDKVKRLGDVIKVADMEKGEFYSTIWEGRKLYPDDKVIE